MTAVEWLTEEMIQRKFFEKETELSYTTLELLTNEANEMFKQQIINAWEDGQNSFPTINAEKYYKEQFKNK